MEDGGATLKWLLMKVLGPPQDCDAGPALGSVFTVEENSTQPEHHRRRLKMDLHCLSQHPSLPESCF
jgi:hypothetical protein